LVDEDREALAFDLRTVEGRRMTIEFQQAAVRKLYASLVEARKDHPMILDWEGTSRQ